MEEVDAEEILILNYPAKRICSCQNLITTTGDMRHAATVAGCLTRCCSAKFPTTMPVKVDICGFQYVMDSRLRGHDAH